MNKTRLHRELLKQQLMNYDYSNTPEDKSILVELDCLHVTVSTEGKNGFTHHKSSSNSIEKLVELMNKRVSENPDFDLIIVDKVTN